MRATTLASLVCAASLTSAAAGQEVGRATALIQETGARCFARVPCDNGGGSVAQRKRFCYTCCSAHCTDVIGCQDLCDRMKQGIDTDDVQHNHNEQGGMAAILQEPMFFTTDLCDDAACVLLAGMLGSTNDSDIRWSLVVAADRLDTCVMPADTRTALGNAIVAVALESDLCWRPRLTAVNAIGDVLTTDVLAVSALIDITRDPKAHPEVRVRAAEILESL